MICSIRARLGGMSEFPLIGQGGLENLVDSLGDVQVRFGQLAKVQQNCPKITEIELGVLPRAIFTSHSCTWSSAPSTVPAPNFSHPPATARPCVRPSAGSSGSQHSCRSQNV